MSKFKTLSIFIILALAFSLVGQIFDVSARPLYVTSPTLGAAGSYSVLAGETVTNTGNTTMPGDLGVSPGSSVSGFPPGIVSPGTIHKTDANAAAAQIDNTAAFLALSAGDNADANCIGGILPSGTDLTTLSPLVPGLYCSAGSFLLTGDLTLSGSSGVWIFKTVSELITSPGSRVLGGDPCNVWWRIGSSATLDTTTSFIGSILALTSISLKTGATLNGRALAQTGAVTLDSNTITGLICLAAPAATATATRRPPGPPSSTAVGLPNTGGAPIQNNSFPWSLVILGGLGAVALTLGVIAYRRDHLTKK